MDACCINFLYGLADELVAMAPWWAIYVFFAGALSVNVSASLIFYLNTEGIPFDATTPYLEGQRSLELKFIQKQYEVSYNARARQTFELKDVGSGDLCRVNVYFG